MCAFHSAKVASSSEGSWPRASSRTGLSESGETRYWYQLMSQATVTTASALIPESVTTDTLGSPDSDNPVRLEGRGHDPDQLEGAFTGWNAHMGEDGRVVPDIARV